MLLILPTSSGYTQRQQQEVREMMNVLRKLQIHEGLKCNLLGDPWNEEGEGGRGGGRTQEVEGDR